MHSIPPSGLRRNSRSWSCNPDRGLRRPAPADDGDDELVVGHVRQRGLAAVHEVHAPVRDRVAGLRGGGGDFVELAACGPRDGERSRSEGGDRVLRAAGLVLQILDECENLRYTGFDPSCRLLILTS